MGLGIPKPAYWMERLAKKKARREELDAFHKAVLRADKNRCQAHDCPWKGEPDAPTLDPHHIIPRGRGGDNQVDNGMTLHRVPCHDRAQNGFWRGDEFISGDQYALEIIAHHEKKGASRWERVKEILLRKDRT
jgi:hypothetical protein